MADTYQPKSPVDALGADLVKPVTGAAPVGSTKALDAQVSSTLGSGYSIASSTYYTVSADVPWVAIAKNVENAMLERSIEKGHYTGEDPGILFIDFYPQPGGAFVLAMDSTTARKGEKLIGYYVLKAAK